MVWCGVVGESSFSCIFLFLKIGDIKVSIFDFFFVYIYIKEEAA